LSGVVERTALAAGFAAGAGLAAGADLALGLGLGFVLGALSPPHPNQNDADNRMADKTAGVREKYLLIPNVLRVVDQWV
jgi:hypothetical protein